MNQDRGSLDEPVFDTIKRDLRVMLTKAKFYLNNSKPTQEEVRKELMNYDL